MFVLNQRPQKLKNSTTKTKSEKVNDAVHICVVELVV